MERSRVQREERPARVAREAPPATVSSPVAALQRSAGNRAVSELLAVGQAKLEVGHADDPLEREADQVAAHVVRAMRSPKRAGEEAGPLRRSTLSIRRRATTAAPEVGLEGGGLSGETEAAIDRARGSGGRPLDAGLQRSMGEAMGADLSGVRVHTGPEAADLSSRVHARAFTIGNDIFSPAALDTETLAHEVTHTVQQGASPLTHVDGDGHDHH